MTTLDDNKTMTHEGRAIDQFTRDADDFAASPIMNDTNALDIIADLTGAGPGTRALDVACGPGIVATRLAANGATVTGLDLTPKMLAVAAETARGEGVDIRWVEGSMYELPFHNGEFDVVVSRYALHHAHELELAASEISRVANKAGRLVIVDFAADEDPDVARAYDNAERHRDPTHVRNLTAAEQRLLFESIGWRMADSRSYRPSASVSAVLAGSNGPDHDGYRTAFEASVDNHQLGVNARRVGSNIRFEYPIVAQTFVHPLSPTTSSTPGS